MGKGDTQLKGKARIYVFFTALGMLKAFGAGSGVGHGSLQHLHLFYYFEANGGRCGKLGSRGKGKTFREREQQEEGRKFFFRWHPVWAPLPGGGFGVVAVQ